MLRRNFLWLASKIAIVFAVIGTGFYSLVRALVPDLFYEPSPLSSVGPPEKFPEGVTFIQDRRLFVVREGNDFSIISAICQHLGCTVNYVPLAKTKEVKIKGKIVKEIWEFACPCHGSKYYSEGTNYAGPAPKPLPHFEIARSALTGELMVNTAKIVKSEQRLKL